ncbi:MAG: glycosyltransferase family 2 protein [Acidobacteria bacterium]|nr:glycosyltransferase family 2 protein [Acidobacteriota bacterium]
MDLAFSVVIPTYNRMDVLPEVLAALEDQEGSPAFEVIVVNDGSTDDTRTFLDERRFTLEARILHQENQGPARARNAGVEAARGQWVAFLGDDTVPSPGWLSCHREAHRRRGDDPLLAVIGYTRWHPRMRRNAFLDYINEYGLQFGYSLIENPENVPFNFFYTSNLSLSRELLAAEPFDLRFPYAAWEDIEASYRLSQRGMRLVYEPKAEVFHDHPTDLRRFCSRQEKAGYSAVVFYGLHPELGGFLGIGPEGPPPPLPEGVQLFREWLARTMQFVPLTLSRLWEELLRGHYIRGLNRGWQDQVHQRKGDPPCSTDPSSEGSSLPPPA